ncbi:MAG: apolipoprotein N-acyltransferase, partial [Planctomycetota bacterium]
MVDRPGGSLSFPGLLGLSAAHAACFHLAFDPVGLWPLVLVALAPLGLIALKARSTRAALAAVIPVQWAANLVSTAWMIGITPLGYVLLGLYVALFAGLFVWIVRRATRHLPRVPLVVIVPIAWVGVECLRGHLLFHGYPWFLLGHPLIGWLSLVQSVDLFGVGFASFIAALVAGAVTECIVNGTAPRARAAVAAAGLLLVANIAYGAVRLRGAPDPAAAGRRGPSMLVTQTNLLQDNKHHWTPQAMETDLPAFIDATRAGFAAAAPPVDLVVWPETMVPGAGFEPAANALLRDAAMSDPGRYRHMHHWADEVTALQAALGVPMLVGSTAWPDARLERDGNVMRARIDTQYNAAYLLDGPPPHARYDKHHLTPFGETMPYISSWDWLEQKLLSIGAAGMAFNLDASAAVSTLELKGVDGPWHLGTPICYEDTVSRVCRDMVWEGGRKRVDV